MGCCCFSVLLVIWPARLPPSWRHTCVTDTPLKDLTPVRWTFLGFNWQSNVYPSSFASTEEKPKLICDLMQGSIIQRFVEDEKSTKSSDQIIIVVLFWTREYFELEPQGEHSCREPGCDFTCRAALTLKRHQVLTCFQKLLIDSE